MHFAADTAFVHKAHNFGNIRRLIAYTLHIGNHFECGGYCSQIPRHRLLLQKQPHAQIFYIPFLLVNLPVGFKYGFFERLVIIYKIFCRL